VGYQLIVDNCPGSTLLKKTQNDDKTSAGAALGCESGGDLIHGWKDTCPGPTFTYMRSYGVGSYCCNPMARPPPPPPLLCILFPTDPPLCLLSPAPCFPTGRGSRPYCTPDAPWILGSSTLRDSASFFDGPVAPSDTEGSSSWRQVSPLEFTALSLAPSDRRNSPSAA
jgi:hypothetical protein